MRIDLNIKGIVYRRIPQFLQKTVKLIRDKIIDYVYYNLKDTSALKVGYINAKNINCRR